MNEVLAALLEGDSSSAWKRYESIGEPSADDQRWAGAALLNLQRLAPARDTLLAARGKGCCAANIELATTYRHLGRPALAEKSLAKVPVGDLRPFDRALYHRERGCIHLANGYLRAAIEQFELAWEDTYAAPEGHHIRASIGQVLGMVLTARGDATLAAQYLDQGLATATPARRGYLLATRGLAHTYMGEFRSAQSDLDAAMAYEHRIPLLRPIRAYYGGLLKRATGDLGAARELLTSACTAAKKIGERETECFAHLALTSVETQQGQPAAAQQSLERARGLADTPKSRAMVALREGTLLNTAGAEGEAIALLTNAFETFKGLDLQREAAWAALHLAEAHHSQFDAASARDALTAAVNAQAVLGTNAPLLSELGCLPGVQQFVANEPHDSGLKLMLANKERFSICWRTQVMLRTFGPQELLVNGEPRKVGFRHAIPILAYLICHPDCGLDQLVTDLFIDTQPAQARNYFHQVRYQVQKTIPALKITHRKGKYRLVSEGGHVTSDFQQVGKMLRTGKSSVLEQVLELYRGPFLDGHDSAWGKAERVRIRHEIISVGVRVLSNEEAHCHECLVRIGWMLLRIDPGNEAIGVLLARRIRRNDAPATAHLALKRLAEHYRDSLDELPSSLEVEMQGAI